MSLLKRIEQGGKPSDNSSNSEGGSGLSSIQSRRVSAPSTSPQAGTYFDLKTRVQNKLIGGLDPTTDPSKVQEVRKTIQELFEQILAEENPISADVVIPVPDSSIPAAIGYASATGLPYNDGFIKNRYIGRTFIEPTDSLRKQGITLKFNVIPENIRGKRVVMIDDSIVRGNTTGPLVRLLRDAGVSEVHVRITCPPIRHPCFMGVDMGTYDELIAHRKNIAEICAHIGADSLAYLSLEGMLKAIGRTEGYCAACFDGCYPLEINPGATKTGFETDAKLPGARAEKTAESLPTPAQGKAR